MILIGMDRGVLKHLVKVRLRSNSHVLLAEVPNLGVEVGMFLLTSIY